MLQDDEDIDVFIQTALTKTLDDSLTVDDLVALAMETGKYGVKGMALLDKAGISYTALNANEEKDLVQKFGVKQAPTLVLVNEGSFEKFRGVSDIKGWLMSKAS